MTNGLGKGSSLVQIISLYWEKRFSREHTKNPNANNPASPDVTLGCGISSPPEFQLVFHIYYVKYENTRAKGLVETRGGGGGDVLNIYLYFLYVYLYAKETQLFLKW